MTAEKILVVVIALIIAINLIEPLILWIPLIILK